MLDINCERQLRGQILENIAETCKAFGHAHRLELLSLLAQGERSVDELARETCLPVASVSQHLQVLRQASLVEVRRVGVRAIYRLENEEIYMVLRAVRDLGEKRLPECAALLQQIQAERPPGTEISFEELLIAMEEGRILLLDVRPNREFNYGHIRGAISMPLDDLEQHEADIPSELPIVVYCRGPYSMLADRAVAWLKQHGYPARRLQQGFPDWQVSGLPVEVAENKLRV
jgi:rhodanese-related sulfurtransferase/DNA-binding transcriptional ArsR family regulator